MVKQTDGIQEAQDAIVLKVEERAVAPTILALETWRGSICAENVIRHQSLPLVIASTANGEQAKLSC